MKSFKWLAFLLPTALCGALAPATAVAQTGSTPSIAAEGQVKVGRSRFKADADQWTFIKAGRLFDAASGKLLLNQSIVIKGDTITDVGANLPVPTGARIIDLSNATVMPGMIDTHVHVNTGGTPAAQRAFIALSSAQSDLYAGFTTLIDMDSRGGFNTVELRDAIDAGLVQGPRMQVVGQSINPRASTYYKEDENAERYYGGRIEYKDVNGPWLARAAVREAKLHGVDWIKLYGTQDFIGSMHLWNHDGHMTTTPSLSVEETTAIVDEAHKLGLKVACHTYDGTASDVCLAAAVDAPMHVLGLDKDGLKIIRDKKLHFVPTIDDLVALEAGDLRDTGGKDSRLKMLEKAVRLAHGAGIPLVFGSGATHPTLVPHGKQADQFAYLVRWGLTPTEALQTTFLNAAAMLNYDWIRKLGSVDKGKYADIIAVKGDPLADITEMERVRFVMKGGLVVRDELQTD